MPLSVNLPDLVQFKTLRQLLPRNAAFSCPRPRHTFLISLPAVMDSVSGCFTTACPAQQVWVGPAHAARPWEGRRAERLVARRPARVAPSLSVSSFQCGKETVMSLLLNAKGTTADTGRAPEPSLLRPEFRCPPLAASLGCQQAPICPLDGAAVLDLTALSEATQGDQNSLEL